MQHHDHRLLIAKDRMETLQREARIEAARRRRVRATSPSTEIPSTIGQAFAARLRRPAFLRLARG